MATDPNEIRANIGIAIDGGGVRGAIVARGIIELEKTLGSPLIDNPRIKVIAGTSTGALICGALAIGMTGQEILTMYQTLGDVIFSKAGRIRPMGKRFPFIGSPTMPLWMLKALTKMGTLGEVLLFLLMPARYSFDPLRETILRILKEHPAPNDNPTLAQLRQHLQQKPHHPTLIITTVEVLARRTRFLKTSSTKFANMPLVESVLASSCIPTYWDPIPLRDPFTGQVSDRLLVDGGVGNFGNPALTVAWEFCDQQNKDQPTIYPPEEVTIFSFGTGYLPEAEYRKMRLKPEFWWAYDWAGLSIDLFIHDAIREQSRNILSQYRGIDLRRFQVTLPKFIAPDNVGAINNELAAAGEVLATLIAENRHALHPDDALRHDPEDIWNQGVAEVVEEATT